jgi:hypothetical protein
MPDQSHPHPSVRPAMIPVSSGAAQVQTATLIAKPKSSTTKGFIFRKTFVIDDDDYDEEPNFFVGMAGDNADADVFSQS